MLYSCFINTETIYLQENQNNFRTSVVNLLTAFRSRTPTPFLLPLLIQHSYTVMPVLINSSVGLAYLNHANWGGR